MARLRYGIPGPGGSLGMCAVCGETFLKEVLFSETVQMLRVDPIDRDLPVHKKCGDAIVSLQGSWSEIRDKFPPGPLHDAFDEWQRESAEKDQPHVP